MLGLLVGGPEGGEPDREELRPDIARLPYSLLGGFKASSKCDYYTNILIFVGFLCKNYRHISPWWNEIRNACFHSSFSYPSREHTEGFEMS